MAVDFLADTLGSRTALIEVTDTKLSDSPAILFTPSQWSAWQDEVASNQFANTNGCVHVTVSGSAGCRGTTWQVAAIDGTVTFLFNEIEWTAFHKGVLDNEFDAETAFALLCSDTGGQGRASTG